MKILAPSSKFEVDTENKVLNIQRFIGSIDLYNECMVIFSGQTFMDEDVPLESNTMDKIAVVNGWRIINKSYIEDQHIVVKMKY